MWGRVGRTRKEGFVAGSPQGGGDSAGGRESPVRAEGGGRKGGTGGGVTRWLPGRNLRDLRVAVAQPGRAQGGGLGPRGRARGESEPAGRPRGNPAKDARAAVVAQNRMDAAGRRSPATKPRGGLLYSHSCLARKMCRTSQ